MIAPGADPGPQEDHDNHGDIDRYRQSEVGSVARSQPPGETGTLVREPLGKVQGPDPESEDRVRQVVDGPGRRAESGRFPVGHRWDGIRSRPARFPADARSPIAGRQVTVEELAGLRCCLSRPHPGQFAGLRGGSEEGAGEDWERGTRYGQESIVVHHVGQGPAGSLDLMPCNADRDDRNDPMGAREERATSGAQLRRFLAWRLRRRPRPMKTPDPRLWAARHMFWAATAPSSTKWFGSRDGSTDTTIKAGAVANPSTRR